MSAALIVQRSDAQEGRFAKEPGPLMHLDAAEMTFHYKDSFESAHTVSKHTALD